MGSTDLQLAGSVSPFLLKELSGKSDSPLSLSPESVPLSPSRWCVCRSGIRGHTRGSVTQEGEATPPPGLCSVPGWLQSYHQPLRQVAAQPLALCLEDAFTAGNFLILVFFAVWTGPNP